VNEKAANGNRVKDCNARGYSLAVQTSKTLSWSMDTMGTKGTELGTQQTPLNQPLQILLQNQIRLQNPWSNLAEF